jgi:hypothetical protein
VNARHGGDDSGLREVFAAMRESREMHAGGFHESVRLGRARAAVLRARVRRRFALTLALALPAAAGLTHRLVELKREREALQFAEAAAAISGWRSPTETLLAHSYADLIREIPSLNASILDSDLDSETEAGAAGGSQ